MSWWTFERPHIMRIHNLTYLLLGIRGHVRAQSNQDTPSLLLKRQMCYESLRLFVRSATSHMSFLLIDCHLFFLFILFIPSLTRRPSLIRVIIEFTTKIYHQKAFFFSLSSSPPLWYHASLSPSLSYVPTTKQTRENAFFFRTAILIIYSSQHILPKSTQRS